MRIVLSGMMLMLLASGSVADEPKADEVAARVTALMRQFTGPSFVERQRAGKALIAIGEPALEALTKAAAGSDPDVAKRAKGCVETIQRDVKVAALARKLLMEPRPEDRAKAADALTQMGREASGAIPSLLKALDDENDHVKVRAIVTLWQLGPKAAPAIAKLNTLIQTPMTNQEVSWAAICGLAWIGPAAKGSREHLLKVLSSGPVRHQKAAIIALVRIEAHDEEVVKAFAQKLTHPDELVRYSAAGALGGIGKYPNIAVPALVKRLALGKKATPSPQDFAATIQALGKFGQDAGEGVPLLIDILSTEKQSIQLCKLAIVALGEIGPPAQQAVPILQKLRSNLTVRDVVSKALSRIDAK